jgi:hypothetical protein
MADAKEPTELCFKWSGKEFVVPVKVVNNLVRYKMFH